MPSQISAEEPCRCPCVLWEVPGDTDLNFSSKTASYVFCFFVWRNLPEAREVGIRCIMESHSRSWGKGGGHVGWSKGETAPPNPLALQSWAWGRKWIHLKDKEHLKGRGTEATSLSPT